MTNREKVQNKAKELGHCLCDLAIKCPCEYFKDFNKCKCAGDDVKHNVWFAHNHAEIVDDLMSL